MMEQNSSTSSVSQSTPSHPPVPAGPQPYASTVSYSVPQLTVNTAEDVEESFIASSYPGSVRESFASTTAEGEDHTMLHSPTHTLNAAAERLAVSGASRQKSPAGQGHQQHIGSPTAHYVAQRHLIRQNRLRSDTAESETLPRDDLYGSLKSSYGTDTLSPLSQTAMRANEPFGGAALPSPSTVVSSAASATTFYSAQSRIRDSQTNLSAMNGDDDADRSLDEMIVGSNEHPIAGSGIDRRPIQEDDYFVATELETRSITSTIHAHETASAPYPAQMMSQGRPSETGDSQRYYQQSYTYGTHQNDQDDEEQFYARSLNDYTGSVSASPVPENRFENSNVYRNVYDATNTTPTAGAFSQNNYQTQQTTDPYAKDSQHAIRLGSVAAMPVQSFNVSETSFPPHRALVGNETAPNTSFRYSANSRTQDGASSVDGTTTWQGRSTEGIALIPMTVSESDAEHTSHANASNNVQREPTGFGARASRRLTAVLSPFMGGDEDEKRSSRVIKTNGLLRNANGEYRPIFMWIILVIQIVLMVVGFIVNYNLTGEVIATSPDFNYMIGPSAFTWIQLGARYTPCIRPTPMSEDPQAKFSIAGAESEQTLSELCGFGGIEGEPNQWYRLIIPMFLHGGIIHLLFNSIFQWNNALQMEREWGAHRLAPIYLLGGFGGTVLGAMLSPLNTVSMGASGAIFALIAACIIDLLQHWDETARRGRMLIELIVMLIISFALGLLPGIDNFAHVGGFLFGILLSLALLPPTAGRVWTILRWSSAAISIAVYAVLVSMFYLVDDLSTICPNCRYINCLPIDGGCDL
jgi:membrane associated rhomboid family serine protease